MGKKRLAKFLILTFVITGTAWWSLSFFIKLDIFSFTSPIGTILHIIGGFGPTIATLFVLEEKLTGKSFIKFVFEHKKNSLIHLAILAVMTITVIGTSSRELNPALPWYFIPVIFVQAILIYGGEEELGWRGIMQPMLERKFKFPIATVITGVTWGIWHIPLWFIEGSSQQNIAFPFFLGLGVILSFLLAALYKKTQCVFDCCVFHGLVNTLLSVFIIKLNLILVIGLILLLVYAIYLWYDEDTKKAASSEQ